MFNTRYSARVHIWGELTESMNPLYEEVLETYVIIVFASAKVEIYEGKILLSNFKKIQ